MDDSISLGSFSGGAGKAGSFGSGVGKAGKAGSFGGSSGGKEGGGEAVGLVQCYDDHEDSVYGRGGTLIRFSPQPNSILCH